MPTHTGVTLNPTSASFYSDTYVQFAATAHYDDGSSYILPWFETVFTSSDTDVATCSSNSALWGRVTGVAAGTATLTCRMTGHSVEDPLYGATAALTVTAPPPPPPPPSSRFSLAFGASTTEAYPTWTAIDAHPNLVTSYSIDRGRSYELDQTDAGRATVTILDQDGILDPTNPTGPHYGQLRPLLPAVLCRRNPVTDTWEERYRGFVEDYTYDIDPSQRVNRLTLSLVDLFEIASSAEMHPGQFGTSTAGGQLRYGTQTPEQRIAAILTDLGIPRRMFVTLPSSITLNSVTYSAGETPLSAIQEAADGEFPNVASVFCDRHGRVCFLGRRARFDPAGTAAAADDSWDYHAWKAGDGTAVNASSTDTAQVRALGFQRGLSKIINTATALEAGVPDDAISGRKVVDTASINTYGIRSWSASNIPILLGDTDQTYPTSAATETRRFAQFYIANYAQPRDRISAITFRSLHPDDSRAAANWDLLTRIDISDTIEVTVHAAGGGGFTAAQYFVEGVHEDVRPLAPGYDDVTVTLDLSPRAYYTVDPWAVPLTGPDPSIPDTVDPNPLKKPRNPKPNTHGDDHKHGGADPVKLDYEKVGAEPGEGGGELDPLAIRYITDNEGDWLDIVTEEVVPGGADALGGQYGTYIHSDSTGDTEFENRAVKIRAKGSGPNSTALTLEALNNAGGQPVGLYTYVPSPNGTGLLVAVNNGLGLNIGVATGSGINVEMGSAGSTGINVLVPSTGTGLHVNVGAAHLLVNQTGVHVTGVLSVNGVPITP